MAIDVRFIATGLPVVAGIALGAVKYPRDSIKLCGLYLRVVYRLVMASERLINHSLAETDAAKIQMINDFFFLLRCLSRIREHSIRGS